MKYVSSTLPSSSTVVFVYDKLSKTEYYVNYKCSGKMPFEELRFFFQEFVALFGRII